MDVEQFALPGIGLRFEITTKAGRRIGVVSHRSGLRELVIYDPEDPARVLPVQEVSSAPSDGYFVAAAFPGVLALLFAVVGLISWSDTRREGSRYQQS